MPTVADLIAATLARAGARKVFVGARGDRFGGEVSRIAPGPAGTALVEAMGRRGLRVVHAGRAASACVMGAVTGLLSDAPGLAVLTADGSEVDTASALAQAWRDRAPLIAVTDRGFAIPAEGAVKASL